MSIQTVCVRREATPHPEERETEPETEKATVNDHSIPCKCVRVRRETTPPRRERKKERESTSPQSKIKHGVSYSFLLLFLLSYAYMPPPSSFLLGRGHARPTPKPPCFPPVFLPQFVTLRTHPPPIFFFFGFRNGV